MDAAASTAYPVVVGEVLFDLFPDGSAVLGGAPFNVAWHLQAFGQSPLVITRIGDDPLGEKVVEAMDGWRMTTAGVQIDREAPTGRVHVLIDDGGPTFDIPQDQAFDRLDREEMRPPLAGFDPGLLYHGSLIARSSENDRALRTLREWTRAPVFVDVNLRAPWWDLERVSALVRGARWVKLNDDELGELADLDRPEINGNTERCAAEFSQRHDVEQLVVTCGERGAFVWTGDRSVSGRPPGDVDVVDTVGAGDAFSAVWITGLLRGWDPETTLVRALDFAAVICGVRGATTDDRRMYDRCLDAWSST